ncbi:PKD domain-containing protein [Chitinophagales bacterium]|nr:PKD domain-containing protein [Chitinophagales bacterium]
MKFVENKGQYPDFVHYELILQQGRLFLEEGRWTYKMLQLPDRHAHSGPDGNEKKEAKGHVFRMLFDGADYSAPVQGRFKYPDYVNYYLGNDPSKWASKVPQFELVEYENLYSCIDLSVYSKGGNVKYDFLVRPGADPMDIQLSFEGAEQIFLDDDGNLKIPISFGTLTELRPYAYQLINGNEIEVPCVYVIEDQKVQFEFPDGYDSHYELVIDPILLFASYSGSSSDNWGYTATYDSEAHLYGGGIVFGNGYPTTAGQFDPFDSTMNGGDCDISITKFSPNGGDLIYSTYIGGSNSELPHSLIVNSMDELIVYGTTGSANYPTTANGADKIFAQGTSVILNEGYLGFSQGTDIILSRFTADGTNLIGSTFFGGSGNDGLNFSGPNSLQYNYGDHARGEVIVTSDDRILIGSTTRSSNIPGSSSIQASLTGGQDGLIAEFSADLSQVNWWTYLGGNQNDAVYSLKQNNAGEIYACGGTESNGFPVPSGAGSFENYQGGQADGFLLRLAENGSAITAGRFVGTSSYDQCFFVDIDRWQDVYVVGQSLGNYPVIGNVYNNPGTKQFISRFNSSLTTHELATTFGNGTSINISPTAFLVDDCDRIYVSGWGGETNNTYNPATGNTNNMPTAGSPLKATTDGSDLYFIVFQDDLEALYYATYYGANTGLNEGHNEHVDGGTSRFDKSGVIYQAVCAGCAGSNEFPTTAQAWSNTNNSVNCNLGVVKIDLEANIIFAGAGVSPAFQTGCIPYDVDLTNMSNGGDYFFWDFGDGDTSTLENPEHTYTEIDTFEIQLVIIDSSRCNITDTAYTQVVVVDTAIVFNPNFEFTTVDDCEPTIVEFTNTTTGENALDSFEYTWNFGDGTTSNDFNVIHEFAEGGIQNVTLAVGTGMPCFQTKYITLPLDLDNIIPTIDAIIVGPEIGCLPFTGTYSSLESAQSYFWTFENEATIEAETFTISLTDIGEYELSLIVVDSTSCNISDTASIVIEMFEVIGISPDFSFDIPVNCEANLLVLDNLTPAIPDTIDVVYTWNFGDGVTSTEFEPEHIYDEAGDYIVTLSLSGYPCFTDTDVFYPVSLPEIYEVDAEIEGNETACLPFSATYYSINPAFETIWYFGNDTVYNQDSIIIDYTEAGDYQVVLVNSDPNSCNLADTATITTSLFTPVLAGPDFSYTQDISCDGYFINFQNLNTLVNDSIDFTFNWDFGNGATSTEVEPSYVYPVPGIYTVTLSIGGYPCINDSLVSKPLFLPFNYEVAAAIAGNEFGCAPLIDVLLAAGNGVDHLWIEEDGTQTSGNSLTINYPNPGEYDITLIAYDEESCNLADTTTFNFSTFETPTAYFEFSPDSSDIDEDIIFDNLSTPGYSYHWTFGDGTESFFIEPRHAYSAPGYYEVCLTAYDPISPCQAVYCEEIYIYQLFLFGAPLGFSPNGDGINDSFVPSGYGFNEYRLMIFNRWGEKVFETYNPKIAWDGTYKDVPQEIGVYLWVINGTTVDQEAVFEKGNLTLIR